MLKLNPNIKDTSDTDFAPNIHIARWYFLCTLSTFSLLKPNNKDTNPVAYTSYALYFYITSESNQSLKGNSSMFLRLQ